MFSTEFDGYNKQEVEKYLGKTKAEYEKLLMDEKLKILEYEKKLLDLKTRAINVEKREKKLASALEAYQKYKNEGKSNIEFLRGEQLRVVYNSMLKVFNELTVQYPGISLNKNYKNLVKDIKELIEDKEDRLDEIIKTGTENDPMRFLLNKMQEKIIDKPKIEKPKEVKIERITNIDINESLPSKIKPVFDMQLNENDKYDNLVDKFMNTKPIDEPKKTFMPQFQSNGFDLKEAINPTDDLSEIMKAFDFYNPDDQ